MPRDEDELSEDMGAKLRKSGARPAEKLHGFLDTFETNEGRVVIGSPGDIQRAKMFARPGSLTRRPRTGDTDKPMVHLFDKNEDIDWSAYDASHGIIRQETQEDNRQVNRQEDAPMVYHGRARGGPYNTMSLVHHQPIYRVAFDPDNPLKGLPGMVASTLAQPCLFGSYLFNEPVKEWIWDKNSISETL